MRALLYGAMHLLVNIYLSDPYVMKFFGFMWCPQWCGRVELST
jgi:hypothetical protein